MSCIFLILNNNNELPTTKRTACQDNILRSVFVFDDVMIFCIQSRNSIQQKPAPNWMCGKRNFGRCS